MANFKGGLSTREDVDALMKLNVAPGASISYDVISDVIQKPRRSVRFETIVKAFVRRIHALKIQTLRENGYLHCLTTNQAHDVNRKGFDKIRRATRRQKGKVTNVDLDRLSEDRQPNQLIQVRLAIALHEEAIRCLKEITTPKPNANDHRPILKSVAKPH
jgi:hypothetical protein